MYRISCLFRAPRERLERTSDRKVVDLQKLKMNAVAGP